MSLLTNFLYFLLFIVQKLEHPTIKENDDMKRNEG